MADIAPGLNFRIGADVKGVQKAIKEAEKSFRGAVSNFSSIGNSLSVALSAPLVAFGAMSLKAAGDLEQLRFALEGTMKGAGRSVEDARIELEALREVALAPGIDFEQAVKGSLRLQSIGYSAEKARKILIELANALALSGGSADQLDGVTRQFAQMAAKGKVMQEDLRIILENMPTLGKVIKDEFGTSTAEGLRDLGVSADQFIERITKKMQDLPRAQGGIANAIVNAGNAVKMALAGIGDELNKTFNITGALDNFSKWISGLAKWFSELSDETKRTIGFVAVFLATIGPAFKVMQAGVFVVGKLQVAFLLFQKALAMSVTEGGIPTFISWWKKLDLAMKTSIIGATVAVVLALGAAWAATSKDMSAAAQAARKVEEVKRASADAIAAERVEIELNTKIAADNNEEMDVRRAALDKLIAISPEYRKALKGETIDTEVLTTATRQLLDSMIRSENARQAIEAIGKIDNAMQDLAESSKPTLWQQAWNVFKAGGNVLAATAYDAQTLGQNMEENRQVLVAQREKLNEFALAQLKANAVVNAGSKGLGDLSEKGKAYAEVVSDIANVSSQQDLLGSEKIVEQAKAIEGGIKKLLDFGFKPASKEVQGLRAQLQGLYSSMKSANLDQLPTLNLVPDSFQSQGDPFAKMLESVKVATGAMSNYVSVGEQMGAINKMIGDGMGDLGEAFLSLSDMLIRHGQIFQGVVAGVVGTMEQLADSGAGIEDMGKGILQSLKKIVGGLIKTGVTAIVTKALLSSALNPFAALALGAASGALAQGLFNSLINKIKVPALAEGGVLTTPQLLLAGEYAGARANPEIVTPENKMRDVFSEVMARSGGGGMKDGQIVATIRGDDIYFLWQKAERKSQRLR